MKKLLMVNIAVVLALLTASSVRAANTNAMLVQIQITASLQQTNIVTTSGVTTTTYTTKSATIGNQQILNMLQAEFSTTFPTGAQLAYNLTGSSGFHVLDASGTDILDVSKNLSDSSYRFDLTNNVTGGGAPEIILGKTAETVSTGNTTQTVTAEQCDYALFYADSHGNNFHFSGLLVLKANASVVSSTTTYNTVSFSINGQGGGTFFNAADGLYDTGVFAKAKIIASGKNLVQ